MNTFNRLAMIAILIGTILTTIVGILAVLFLRYGLGRIFINFGTLLSLPANDPRIQELLLELIVAALIVFIPCVVLLFLELRRSNRDSIRIAQVTGGSAQLSTQAVGQSLIYYIDAMPGVVRVKPRLSTNGKTVDVRLDVETTPDVDVRAKTEEITRMAHSVVEEKLGLKFTQPPRIYIHHAPFPRGVTPPQIMPAPTYNRPASFEPPKPPSL